MRLFRVVQIRMFHQEDLNCRRSSRNLPLLVVTVEEQVENLDELPETARYSEKVILNKKIQKFLQLGPKNTVAPQEAVRPATLMTTLQLIVDINNKHMSRLNTKKCSATMEAAKEASHWRSTSKYKTSITYLNSLISHPKTMIC